MNKDNFNYLIGKTRHEVKAEMGDGFNFFKDNVWTYQVGETWLGKKVILSVLFVDNHAANITLHKTFKSF
ncbi:hypothetical protein [Chryseobacterium culicis]|uniref:Uncharacterized protein n=1 Tax=Chryseobacterium culicis TaxID=680127 RepID=A0A1H6HCT6_CHRCI|nr:hypothetical protein [Chryseobacterium culicis]SEH31938.1 hypothetical protein SAMN05421593_1612 [Chryseobacterium culicis]